MRTLKFITLIVLLSCTTDKNAGRVISIDTIDWQFTLAKDTNFRDSSFDAQGKILEEIPSYGPSLRLFAIKDSPPSAFATYIRKDTLTLADWKNWHDKDTKWYFEEMGKLPGVTILEKKYYSTNIDSVNFLVQYTKSIKKGNADTTWSYHHFGRINGIELDISFWYTDELIGKKYKDIIRHSKFGSEKR